MDTAIDRNPMAVFLSSMSPGTRCTYECDLRAISSILGEPDPYTYNWAALRFQHTHAIRCQSSPVNVPVIRGNNDPVIRGNDVPPFEWMRNGKVQDFGRMLKDSVSSFAPPPTGFCVPSSGS
jgi:hypothetical protein